MRSAILALVLSAVAQAANVHCGPTSTGNGSGSDWNNQCAMNSLTPARGNVYYLADGSYNGKTLTVVNSGTTTIEFRKAIVADHGSATGWSDTMGDGQAIFGGMSIQTDYWIFNGQVRNSNWRTGAVNQYGIVFGNTRIDDGSSSAGADNVTFQYVDIHGGGRDTGDGDDVIYTLYGGSNITFQYCALRDSDRTIFLTRGVPTNWIIEYSYIARNASSAAIHGEIWSTTEGSGVIFRYNIVEDPEGTAVFAFINGGVSQNYAIYGNVFKHSASYNREGITGIVYCANDASNDNTCNNLRFTNNTIWQITGAYSGIIIQSGTGAVVQNNMWYNSVRTNNSFSGTQSHNWYYNTNAEGENSNTQTCTTGCNIFTSATTNDYTLTAATNAGTTLSSPYNVDPNGTTRGADGTWDRGAFEFGSGSGATVPTVVTGSSASNITASTADVTGNSVSSDGGATITERGCVISTSANPTTGDTKVTVAGTTGSFDCSFTGRSPSTVYHVRAFGTNSVGTSYGDDINFTTSPSAPGSRILGTSRTLGITRIP